MSSSSVTSQFTIGDLRGNPRRIRKERGMRLLLLVAAATSIVISALIVYTLFKEAWHFLVLLSDESGLGALIDDGANPGWYPRNGRFDLPTLVIGTVLVSLVSIVVAAPLGLGSQRAVEQVGVERPALVGHVHQPGRGAAMGGMGVDPAARAVQP